MANTTGTNRKTSEEIKESMCGFENAKQAKENSINDIQSRNAHDFFFGGGGV